MSDTLILYFFNIWTCLIGPKVVISGYHRSTCMSATVQVGHILLNNLVACMFE
jgi:hypothetical protein